MPSAKTYVDIIGRDKTKAATKSAVSNMQRLEVAATSMVASMAPLAAGAALGGFAALIKGQIDAADSIQKMSLQLQVSTEALSQYKHVADSTGTSFETITKGIRYMQKNMSDAEDGLSTAKRAFGDLNLEVGNLRRLAPEDAFELIGQRLSEIEDPAKRTQLAMNVFGRAGAELNQTFSDGAAAVRALREEADRLGVTLSQEAADNAAEANDAITRLEASFSGLGRTLAVSVAPALTKAADGLSDFVSEAKGFADTGVISDGTMFNGMVDALGKVNPGLASAAGFFGLIRQATADTADEISGAPSIFTATGEAAQNAASGVYLFGSEVDDVAPKVRAAATVAKDYTSALSYIEQYQREGLFGVDMLSEVDNYVNSLAEVGEEGSRSMEILASSARSASSRMSDAIAAAVFESEDLLEGLGGVARSVFGSILSNFISIGVSSIFNPAGAAASAVGEYGPDLIGPAQKSSYATPAPAGGGVTVGSLNVNLSAPMSGDSVSARQLAEDLYSELRKIEKHHG